MFENTHESNQKEGFVDLDTKLFESDVVQIAETKPNLKKPAGE